MSILWLHVLNINFLTDWLQTCGFFCSSLCGVAADLKSMLTCQGPWEPATRTWCIFSFWLGVLIACINFIVSLFSGGRQFVYRGGNDLLFVNLFNFLGLDISINIGGTNLGTFLTAIVTYYINAHIAWFSIIRTAGCCCCLVACIEAHIILLVQACWQIFWGVADLFAVFNVGRFAGSNQINDGYWVLGIIFAFLFAIIRCYIGICAIYIWRNRGAELCPSNCQVTVLGPSTSWRGDDDDYHVRQPQYNPRAPPPNRRFG